MRARVTAGLSFALLLSAGVFAQTPDAQRILDKVAAQYKGMQSYKADGKVTADADGGKTHATTTFSMMLKKPNLYVITWATPVAGKGGAAWNSGNQAYLYVASAAEKSYSKMADDGAALSAAAESSGGAARTVPALFFAGTAGLGSPLELTAPKIEKTEKLDGEDCYVISGSSGANKKETLWISTRTYMIRQLRNSGESPAGKPGVPQISDQQLEQAFKQSGRPMPPEVLAQVKAALKQAQGADAPAESVSTEHHVKILTAELNAADFAFKVPEGAALQESTAAAGGPRDANWWYDKYKKLGDSNPKWDSLVREGIDHWMKAYDPKTDSTDEAELAVSVKALEKAYAAGCRCPIALFIDARNISRISASGEIVFDRFNESLARCEGKPELTFVRIPCANGLAYRYLSCGMAKEAIPYFELALSLKSPDVEKQVLEEAQTGLKQARERAVADQALKEQQQALKEQVAAMNLPPNPSKEQALAYVHKIIYMASKKMSTGNNDPEIAMLEKVGPENLDVLLKSWGGVGAPNFAVNAYVTAAVERLARPQDTALLLKWLPLQEGLTEVMLHKGWVQDMRPFLVARIAERAQWTDPAILHAAAALRDPATYADLIWFFENSQNGLNIYDDIKNLPGIQLKDAVARVWAASKSWTDWRANSRNFVAMAAMEQGVTDALEFALAKVDSPEVDEWTRANLSQAIRERTGRRGSDDDIRAWFKANKDKLIFDETRRMFVVKP